MDAKQVIINIMDCVLHDGLDLVAAAADVLLAFFPFFALRSSFCFFS